jgi:hypothetical protein
MYGFAKMVLQLAAYLLSVHRRLWDLHQGSGNKIGLGNRNKNACQRGKRK